MYSTCMWGCLEAPSQNLLACLEVLGCIRFLLSFSQRNNRQWEAKQHLQSLTRATKRLSNCVIEALSCNTMWLEIGQRSSHSPRIKKRPEITRPESERPCDLALVCNGRRSWSCRDASSTTSRASWVRAGEQRVGETQIQASFQGLMFKWLRVPHQCTKFTEGHESPVMWAISHALIFCLGILFFVTLRIQEEKYLRDRPMEAFRALWLQLLQCWVHGAPHPTDMNPPIHQARPQNEQLQGIPWKN